MKCWQCIQVVLLPLYFLCYGCLPTSNQLTCLYTLFFVIVLLCWFLSFIRSKNNLKILHKIFGRLKNLPYICVVNVWQTIRSVGILHPTRHFFYPIYKKIVRYYSDNHIIVYLTIINFF